MRPDEPRRPGRVWFGRSKCCTYHPQLHNFLAGAVLADRSAALASARARLEVALAARTGVSPLGVLGPRSYWLLYDATPEAFGRGEELRCPFYDEVGGGCGVWGLRESTCATWFCKHDRGAVGEAFWTAARRLLQALERAVARHCLVELELGADALAAVLAEGSAGPELGAPADEAAIARAWGRWRGRERELFVECARIARGLSPAAVLAAGGADARLRAEILRARFRELGDDRPPSGPLRAGSLEVVDTEPPSCVVVGYRRLDPVELPQALAAALLRFDGRATERVVEEVRRELGLVLDGPTLRTLADFRLLVPLDPG
jgi:hypothetical protein